MKIVATCFYCEGAAEFLCDALAPIQAFPDATCDRPLCSKHRRRVGHICKRSRKNRCATIDYCPDHYEAQKGGDR